MHKTLHTIPLNRRIIDNFLMYSLACLFLCLAIVLTLQWRGLLVSHASLAVLVPMICILLGTMAFRRMLQSSTDIERQLRSLAETPSQQLSPVFSPDQVASGWNTIIDRLTAQDSLQSLESRISQSMGNIQNQKYEQVFNHFPEGLVVSTADGIILHSNRAFPAVMNWDVETEFTNQSLVELLKLDSLENGEEIKQKTEQQMLSLVFEIRPSNFATETIIRVARYRLQEEGGGESGYLWCFRDVTQAKLAEEMRNQFVFTATHELRTPLANIQAYAETLALDEQIDVEQQKQFCNIINSEVTRLSRFVDELLNVSQMEAGALALTKQETDIARLLEEVLEHVKPQMVQKQIKLEVLMPPKLPKLSIDKDKITASLVNLLGNAAKYTPAEGQVRFTVIQSATEIQMEVEDSGYGIAEDELEKVFDKFFRSTDERVRSISGSGLGLAFAREAVRLHGGNIEAFSELNKGTKFILSLPVK